jgi:addiction module HigA family antidote
MAGPSIAPAAATASSGTRASTCRRNAAQHPAPGRPDRREKMTVRYLVILEKGPTSYGAHVPDLPGCVAVGETEEEARTLIREAIAFHIEGLRDAGEPVPPPPRTARRSRSTRRDVRTRPMSETLPPVHPGEILLEEFLLPMGLSTLRLSRSLSVPHRLIKDIVRGKTSITADIAARLAQRLGTSNGLWLNLQSRHDWTSLTPSPAPAAPSPPAPRP